MASAFDERPFDRLRTAPDAAQIQQAIVETLIYADLFDFPLSFDEIARYLTVPADPETIRRLLDEGSRDGVFARSDGLFTLPGRTQLVALRARRQAIAQQKWAAVRRPLRWIARLPFVRMVAVTGSLAVNNVEEADDVDLFIATTTGRLWLCRAFVILVVRLAARFGVTVCPNYFLSERRLSLDAQSFFDARELTQMRPLYGADVYFQMRDGNGWVAAYLPRASGPPGETSWIELNAYERTTKWLLEQLCDGWLGGWLDAWEMRRKVQRFALRSQGGSGHVLFNTDCCKGHFDGHGEIIPRRFAKRLAHYGLVKEKIDG